MEIIIFAVIFWVVIAVCLEIRRGMIDREIAKQKEKNEAEYRAMLNLAAQEDAAIAARPDPYLGMDEKFVRDTNWGTFFHCLENVSTNAIERKYYKDNNTYLLFRNGKLVEIQGHV